jgi:hypothetical protein
VIPITWLAIAIAIAIAIANPCHWNIPATAESESRTSRCFPWANAALLFFTFLKN